MKKTVVIVIVVILVSILSLFFLNHGYGIFTPYNYFTAKRDLNEGIVQLITSGDILPSNKDFKIEQLALKYGFTFKNLGVDFGTGNSYANGIEAYNNVVENYLIQRNGPDWEVNYSRQVDSLYRSGGQ